MGRLSLNLYRGITRPVSDARPIDVRSNGVHDLPKKLCRFYATRF